MAAFAFTLPILPGQEEVVSRIGEAVSGSGEFYPPLDDLDTAAEKIA